MEVGDLIKYRIRRPSDPHPNVVGKLGVWGSYGIVMNILYSSYQIGGNLIPSIEYVDFDGDWVICKQEDVEVINGRKD